jgi:RimJ/RimL family protein N-acetyltransferase
MLTAGSVELRPRTDADEAVLYRVAADLDTWEERTERPPAPLTLAAYRQARESRGNGAVEFVVAVDGAAVGGCTLFHEDQLARHAEVGIALLPEARGRGHGTVAIGLLVDFAFTRRNLRRVHLVLIASNEAAIASYRKAGFVEEARRREHCWARGRYVDEVGMGLLRADWQAPGLAWPSVLVGDLDRA